MGVDPVSAILLGVGTAISVGGSVMQGVERKRAADTNAARRDAMARDELRRGGAQSAIVSRDARRFMARQIAQINAMGGSIDSGTSLAFAQQAGADAQLDILNTVADSQNSASALRVEARDLRRDGRSALRSGLMGGAATAVQGFQKWRSLQE